MKREKEVLVLPVVAVRCHISCSKSWMQTRVFSLSKAGESQAKKREGSSDKLSRVKSHPGSLPQVKRAEVLENFLAAGIPLRKIDHLHGLLEAGAQHLTKSSGMSELFPTVHAMAKKDLLDLRLARCKYMYHARHYYPVIFDGSTRQGEAIAPSSFASSTNSGRLFNVLSGSTSLPSPLQALSYRRYYKMKACSRISKY